MEDRMIIQKQNIFYVFISLLNIFKEKKDQAQLLKMICKFFHFIKTCVDQFKKILIGLIKFRILVIKLKLKICFKFNFN